MKRLFLTFALLIPMLLSSCFLGDMINKYLELPESVDINGVIYKKAFESGLLYPLEKEPYDYLPTGGVEVGSHEFYEFNNTEYDCRIAYDPSNASAPCVYFSEADFDAAVAYYGNKANYTETLVMRQGEEYLRYPVELDTKMEQRLREFQNKNETNPFDRTPETNAEAFEIPMPGNRFAYDVFFFECISLDGSFDKSVIGGLRFYEDEVVWVEHYSCAKGAEVAVCVPLDKELSDYVKELYADAVANSAAA